MIYLAGDSVFDNAAYTSPSLIQQMGAGARLLARDGAVIATLASQLRGVEPTDTDVLVISVGGNDAMGSIELVMEGALELLSRDAGTFQIAYLEMLAEVFDAGWRRVLVCTIYNGNFDYDRAAIAAGVRLFDDAIQRCARRARFDVLELRDLFTDPADYANPIEPSHVGGAKLVAAIRDWAVRA